MAENKLMTVEQAEAQTKALAGFDVWTDKAAFEQLLRVANMLSQSNIVPAAYQGKPQDCFVACELANRMSLSPITVMQNLNVIKGKPSWSGPCCMALIENCGKYRTPTYETVGEVGTSSWGCKVVGVRKSDGAIVVGTTVTMAMAQAEGWTSNPKWRSMPEQMLKYRAAAFFARAHCPEALMGLQTTEEVEDCRHNAAADLNNELETM